MLLRHSHTSPFVRKVTVLLHENGLAAWHAAFATRPSMVATRPPA